jgi:hypothetical protein
MEMVYMSKNRVRWSVGLVLMMAVSMLAGPAGSAPTWGGSMGMEDDWPVVNNPATAMAPEEVIKPEQQWRIGADEEDVIFGLIEDALVGEDGSIYLLDTVLNTVYVMDDNGEIVGNLGGEGDGPGEFRFAREMVFLPKGTLGIMEMMPGKVVVVDLEGNPHPSFALTDDGQGMMYHMQHVDANKEAVLIGKVVTAFNEGSVTTKYSLSSYDGDGSEIATLFEHSEKQSGGNISLSMGGGENAFTSNFTLCDDGRVVVFQNPKEYKLEVLDAGGTKKHIIRRDYETVRRSDEELEESRLQAEQMRERFNGNMEMAIEEFADDISDVIARPNGDIWVANSQGNRDCPENSIGIFDVFDTEGHYTKQVRIEADYDPERDQYKLEGDMLFVFKEAQNAPDRTSTMGGGGGGMMVMMVSSGGASDEDEDEEIRPYEVICYRLPR